MSPRAHARTAARRPRWALLAGSAVAAALVGAVAWQASPSPSPAAAPADAVASAALAEPSAPAAAPPAPPSSAAAGRRDLPDAPDDGHARPSALGETGDAGAAVTAFDDSEPTVANLDPALLAALRAAATDAADDGVQVVVNSGWRSVDEQERLLEQAVVQYGSAQEAARWVATPQTSAHVSGDAVDVGHADATSWLSRYGAAYGLCQVYANESWHYELRPDAVDAGCPAMYADPTQDPRMQP